MKIRIYQNVYVITKRLGVQLTSQQQLSSLEAMLWPVH